MKRGLFLLCGAFLLAAPAAADDASVQEDLHFIQELRKQGKSDLALEYLKRISKDASPELAKQLPLEMATAKLDAAADEPDSGKRLSLYTESRDDFQKWLAANPTSSRVGEVQLHIAQVAVMQGRTQLSRASMDPNHEVVVTPEAMKARAMLEDAAVQIKQAAKVLDDQLANIGDPKTPADKELKKKLSGDRAEAEMSIGRNLFDQAQTFPGSDKATTALRTVRGDKITQAQKVFEKLASKEEGAPIGFVAKAWYARCFQENGDPPKARNEYTKILDADKQLAKEAQRLVRYFRLLAIQESIEPKEDAKLMIHTAEDWIKDYPGYLKTPEGYAVRYFLASVYFDEVVQAKLSASDRATDLKKARDLLRQVEQSENDYTDLARQLKIDVIYKQQGGFTQKVEDFKSFEDCYVRAQYEMAEMSKEEQNPKLSATEREQKRKEREATVAAALLRGLKLAADDKSGHGGAEALELGNAKALLAFLYMNAKKYQAAIDVAEPFARSDPRSSQAADCAIYAMQCYAEMISNQEQAGHTDAELKTERDNLFKLAAFMEKTWPKEGPGDKARHQLALLYINDKDPDKRDENVQKAIEALGRITPAYAQYTVTQYQLAEFAFGADKDKLKPMPGDGPDGYRKRALAALENIPPLVAGADPTTNKVYFLAKIKLAQEDFTLKKFDEMEQLTTMLLPKLPTVQLDADKANDDKLHGEFTESIKNFRLYARWAKADAEAKAGHPDKVMALLDPIVDEITANQHPELKGNLPLARGILDNALRAAIQLNKLDRAPVVLNCYKQLATGDTADAGAAEVLKQLVVFIPPQLDELKRKKDEAALKKAQETFGKILDDTIKPLSGDKLTPKLKYFTAQIYSSMDRHKEAAELLDQVPEPAKDAAKPDVDLYQTVRVLYVRERRLNGETDEARKAMDVVMGDPKTGWGRKKVDALVENVELLGAEGKNKEAAEFANALIQKLLSRVDADPRMKEVYLQCYYLMVENAYHQAQKLKDKAPDKYAKGVKIAATLAVDLAKKQTGLVNDATRGRFRDLMDAEPDLKGGFVDGYVAALESGTKEADALKDKGMRDKAISDVASMVVDLEKLWPDYGGDAAKEKVTALLANNADLKTAYDQLKGAAPQ